MTLVIDHGFPAANALGQFGADLADFVKYDQAVKRAQEQVDLQRQGLDLARQREGRYQQEFEIGQEEKRKAGAAREAAAPSEFMRASGVNPEMAGPFSPQFQHDMETAKLLAKDSPEHYQAFLESARTDEQNRQADQGIHQWIDKIQRGVESHGYGIALPGGVSHDKAPQAQEILDTLTAALKTRDPKAKIAALQQAEQLHGLLVKSMSDLQADGEDRAAGGQEARALIQDQMKGRDKQAALFVVGQYERGQMTTEQMFKAVQHTIAGDVERVTASGDSVWMSPEAAVAFDALQKKHEELIDSQIERNRRPPAGRAGAATGLRESDVLTEAGKARAADIAAGNPGRPLKEYVAEIRSAMGGGEAPAPPFGEPTTEAGRRLKAQAEAQGIKSPDDLRMFLQGGAGMSGAPAGNGQAPEPEAAAPEGPIGPPASAAEEEKDPAQLDGEELLSYAKDKIAEFGGNVARGAKNTLAGRALSKLKDALKDAEAGAEVLTAAAKAKIRRELAALAEAARKSKNAKKPQGPPVPENQ